MKQHNLTATIEFYIPQDPAEIEALLRQHLPQLRRLWIGIDHKNVKRVTGQTVMVRFTCEVDGVKWAVPLTMTANGGGYTWRGSNLCPKCNGKGKAE